LKKKIKSTFFQVPTFKQGLQDPRPAKGYLSKLANWCPILYPWKWSYCILLSE